MASIGGGYLARAIRDGMLPVVDGRYQALDSAIEQFFEFVRRDIRTRPVLARLKFWEPSGRAPRRIQRYYEQLVGDLPLAELPARPRFVLCATNLFFANSWICKRTRIGDYLSRYVKPPPADWTLARTIAVSSCFPPVFDPAPANLPPGEFSASQEPDDDSDAQSPPEETARLNAARSQITLTDGGV